MRIRIRTDGKIHMSTLVLMSYGLYVMWRIFYNSCIIIEYGSLFNLFSYAVQAVIICVSLFSIVASRQFHTSEFLYELVLLGVGFVVSVLSGYAQLFFVFLLVVAAKDIPFRRVVKTAFLSQLLAVSVVVVASIAGILPNYCYRHEVSEGVVRMAYTYGFTYYTTPAYILLAMMLEWGYLNFEKVTVVKLAIWTGVQYAVYMVFTSRASFFMSIGYLAVLFVFSKIKRLKIEKPLWRLVAWLGFPVLLIANYILVQQYAQRNEIAYEIDELISGRLYYSAKAIADYGIQIFGSKVVMVGNYEISQGLADSYFYIDSGYMYSLICYGIAATVLLLLSYSLIFARVSKDQDKAVYCWLLVYMVMNLNNNMLVSVHYNPLLFLLPYALQQINPTAIHKKRVGGIRRPDIGTNIAKQYNTGK